MQAGRGDVRVPDTVRDYPVAIGQPFYKPANEHENPKRDTPARPARGFGRPPMIRQWLTLEREEAEWREAQERLEESDHWEA